MARRVDNECAYCAEEFEQESGIVGEDMKVYCTAECARLGESLSAAERARSVIDPDMIAA